MVNSRRPLNGTWSPARRGALKQKAAQPSTRPVFFSKSNFVMMFCDFMSGIRNWWARSNERSRLFLCCFQGGHLRSHQPAHAHFGHIDLGAVHLERPDDFGHRPALDRGEMEHLILALTDVPFHAFERARQLILLPLGIPGGL